MSDLKLSAVLLMPGVALLLMMTMGCEPLSLTASDSDVAVTGVTIDSTALHFAVGDAGRRLTATIVPADAANTTVSWSTNNSAVATVSSSGLVTPVAAGTAIITVTTDDAGKTATCMVTVIAPAPIFGSWAVTKVEEKGIFRKIRSLNGVDTVVYTVSDTTIDLSYLINQRVSNFKSNGWRVDTYIYNIKDSVHYTYSAIDSAVTVTDQNGLVENARFSLAGSTGILQFSNVVDTLSSSTDGITGTISCQVFTGTRCETMARQ